MITIALCALVALAAPTWSMKGLYEKLLGEEMQMASSAAEKKRKVAPEREDYSSSSEEKEDERPPAADDVDFADLAALLDGPRKGTKSTRKRATKRDSPSLRPPPTEPTSSKTWTAVSCGHAHGVIPCAVPPPAETEAESTKLTEARLRAHNNHPDHQGPYYLGQQWLYDNVLREEKLKAHDAQHQGTYSLGEFQFAPVQKGRKEDGESGEFRFAGSDTSRRRSASSLSSPPREEVREPPEDWIEWLLGKLDDMGVEPSRYQPWEYAQ